MKNKRPDISILLFFMIIEISCRQSYQPPAINANRNYLVVDAFLNAGSDSTIVTLTRTRNLTAPSTPIPEPGAQVSVEGDGGYARQLPDIGDGKYAVSTLNLDLAQKYRLRIVTGNGSKYLSDYTPVTISPPIDSISWQRNDTGVVIYANTHDPLNNTRYYRWDFTETWEYHSFYTTYLSYDTSTGTVTTSNINSDSVHVCWNSDHSTGIVTASSAKLTKDIIYLAPLTVVPTNSEKISVKYSILARQYALTMDAFNYWQILQKSTEQGGTLFDQEPTQVTGNIHCLTNPGEPVIGYVGAGVLTQLRIFIDNSQVLPWFYDPGCTVKSSPLDSVGYYYFRTNSVPILQTAGSPNPRYNVVHKYCVDCTLVGRTTVKPSFWP